jgi:NTP pyrophosphatase (non-canonical NTP hydrolase)
MFTPEFLERFNTINSKFSEKNKERGYDHNTEAMYSTLKLGEEYGELSEQVLSALGHQRQVKLDSYNKSNLEGEIADVIIQTLVVASLFDVDVSVAVNNKIDILNDKINNY